MGHIKLSLFVLSPPCMVNMCYSIPSFDVLDSAAKYTVYLS